MALAEPPESDSSPEPNPKTEDSPAESESPATSETESSGEIIIYGERELARKRAILDSQIRVQGYGTVKKSENKTVYRPDIAWKPSVIVYDDGYMILRRTPVRFEPWFREKRQQAAIFILHPAIYGAVHSIRVAGQWSKTGTQQRRGGGADHAGLRSMAGTGDRQATENRDPKRHP